MPRQCSMKAAEAVGNRYDLVLIASVRVRELNRGHKRKMDIQDNNSIAALVEIENGLVGREYLKRIHTRNRRKNHEYED